MSHKENTSRAAIIQTMLVMDLVRNVIKHSCRMEMTSVVDDDFPEVKHYFDSAVIAYADYLRGSK